MIHAGPNPKYFNRGRGVTWYNLLYDQGTGSTQSLFAAIRHAPCSAFTPSICEEKSSGPSSRCSVVVAAFESNQLWLFIAQGSRLLDPLFREPLSEVVPAGSFHGSFRFEQVLVFPVFGLLDDLVHRCRAFEKLAVD